MSERGEREAAPMEIDRAAITGRSFSRSSEGYARDEVDRHLADIAEAVEAARLPPVEKEAEEQLASILEGAQRSASALRERAEAEARQLAESARKDAEVTRERAEQQAAEQIETARAAVQSLLERVEALKLGVDEAQSEVRRAGEEMAGVLERAGEPLVETLGQRAAALGADYEVRSAPGAGTTVLVRVPIDGWRLGE